MCKTSILRSLGYHSKLTPSAINSLCPLITENCCTNHDLMKIHKTWNTSKEKYLKEYYDNSLQALRKISAILNVKDELNLSQMTLQFIEQKQPEKKLKKHLKDLGDDFSKFEADYYKEILKGLTKTKMIDVYKQMTELRKGFLCMSCSWQNQQFINTESLTVSYKYGFCSRLVDVFLDVFQEKYVELVKMVLTLNEWVFLTTGFKMISEDSNRNLLKRFIVIIEKCDSDKSVESCSNFCREFNVNRFTQMFDGEQEIFVNLIENFSTFYEKFKKHKNTLFDTSEQMNDSELTDFQDNFSVFSKKLIKKPQKEQESKNSFQLSFQSKSKSNFIEKKHRINEVQIDLMDEELDTFALFEMNDEPIDVSSFLIVFDPFKGLNLFDDVKQNNLSEPADKILSLIHQKDHNPENLNEFIESDVESIIQQVQIKDYSDFFNDFRLYFKKVKRTGFEIKADLEKFKPNKGLLHSVLGNN